MNEPCKKIRPLLADYCDGELPPSHAASIAAHLADCASCRVEVRLLEDSLSLAQEVWNENVSPLPTNLRSVPGEGPGVWAVGSKSRPKVLLVGGLALCASIVFVAIGFSLFSAGKPSTARKSNSPPLNNVTPVPAVVEEVDAMEYIAREGRAARLAASMQMLATEPNLKAYKDNAERYLRENYADTTAVRMLDK